MTVSMVLWCLLAAFVIAQISSFFTTIYLHRAMTHQSLILHPVVGNLMHLWLIVCTGIVPREWAAVHRKHHRFSDEEGDPHSPYIEGLWKVLFLNVVMYRRETRNPDTIATFTPHWKDDLIDKIPNQGLVGPIFGISLLACLFGWLLGTSFGLGAVLGVATAFVNAGMYIFLNSMINSVCHKVGYRNFDNKATNLQWVAMITAGEGLHNNHHEFPMSATMKARKREFDPAWPVIRLLEKMNLAEYKKSGLAKDPDEVGVAVSA
ncbi:MAG: fatty acid desaturase [Bryobacterales bacterium]